MMNRGMGIGRIRTEEVGRRKWARHGWKWMINKGHKEGPDV